MLCLLRCGHTGLKKKVKRKSPSQYFFFKFTNINNIKPDFNARAMFTFVCSSQLYVVILIFRFGNFCYVVKYNRQIDTFVKCINLKSYFLLLRLKTHKLLLMLKIIKRKIKLASIICQYNLHLLQDIFNFSSQQGERSKNDM